MQDCQSPNEKDVVSPKHILSPEKTPQKLPEHQAMTAMSPFSAACISETDASEIDQHETSPDISLDLITYAALCLGPFLQSNVVELTKSPVDSPNGTPFDAARIPQIDIETYIDRMFQYSQLTPESGLASLIILRRLSVNYPEMRLTNFNVHRIFLTSCLVFAKYYDDDLDTNARWARIAGVSLKELNAMEVDLLNRCQFDLRVSQDCFHATVLEVVSFAKTHHCSPCSTPTGEYQNLMPKASSTNDLSETCRPASVQRSTTPRRLGRKTLSGALHALFHLHLHHHESNQQQDDDYHSSGSDHHQHHSEKNHKPRQRMKKEDRMTSSTSLPEVLIKSALSKRKQSFPDNSSFSVSPIQSPKHHKRGHGHLKKFVKRPQKRGQA